MTEKFALYARVSTDEQFNQQQVMRLSEYASRMGWDVVLFEEVESTRKTRPIKEALLKRLRAGEFSGVCVWKLDRWARSTQELILEIAELYHKGVLFVSVSDSIDLSSPSGRLQFHIMSAFAEFERELIRERTKEGLRRAVRNGRVLGRPRRVV